MNDNSEKKWKVWQKGERQAGTKKHFTWPWNTRKRTTPLVVALLGWFYKAANITTGRTAAVHMTERTDMSRSQKTKNEAIIIVTFFFFSMDWLLIVAKNKYITSRQRDGKWKEKKAEINKAQSPQVLGKHADTNITTHEKKKKKKRN